MTVALVGVVPVPAEAAWPQRLLQLLGRLGNWPPSGQLDAGPLGVASAAAALPEGTRKLD